MCVCMCCAKLNLLITQANLNYFRGLLLSVCRGEGKERKGKERKIEKSHYTLFHLVKNCYT